MSARSWARVLILSAVTGGLVALGAFLLLDWTRPGEITIGPALVPAIAVSLEGAVATPGVYSLPAGSRLTTAIEMAGGLTDEADATGLYLARRLADGEHVVIPGPTFPATGTPQPATPGSASGSGPIDINTAGIAELETLPGVGPVIAQRIVDFREFYGPFESIEQLDQVDGISATMVEEIRPLVTIDD